MPDLVKASRPRGTTHPPPVRSAAEAPRLEAAIERQLVLWEAQVCLFMAVLVMVPVGMVGAISSVIGGPLAGALVALCVVISAYFGLCSWRLRRASIKWLPLVRLFNVTLEASFGTITFLLVVKLRGPEFAMAGSTVFVYVVALAAIAARMRPLLCLYASAVVVVEYLFAYYLAVKPRLDPELLSALPPLGTWNAWQRAFWLFLAGAVSAFATYKAREWARFAGAQAFEKRRLEKEFGRYVSPNVADAVLRGEAEFGRAEKRQVTVLFLDLRDFTAMCEREAPEKVVQFLNTFFERTCKIIESHGGTVNKFLGDGILALFGAPDEHPMHAYAAAEAAHEIVQFTDELRASGGMWQEFDVGIGLDTGTVVAGAIGSRDRLEYTAIGATVNRAARLQSLSRDTHRRIIVSRACAQALGPRANLVSLGEVGLKGFSAPEPVYAFRHS